MILHWRPKTNRFKAKMTNPHYAMIELCISMRDIIAFSSRIETLFFIIVSS